MNEFLEQFCLESRELVEQATRELLALETEPDSREALDGAFRAFHTLKGGAGIVDFFAMSRCLHVGEEALSQVRQGQAAISAAMIGDSLNVIDQVVQWLDEIEASGDLPRAPDAAADAAIARFQAQAAPPPASLSASEAPQADAALTSPARLILEEQGLLIAHSDPVGRMGRVASAARVAANVLRRASRPDRARDIERAAAAFADSRDATALANLVSQALNRQREPEEPAPRALGRSFRVDAERVDALVSLTGELIVVKNTLAHLAATARESQNPLAAPLSQAQLRLDRLVGRLKDTALNLRVTPIRSVFERFQRIVRDLAVELDKPTRLVVEGEDTQADKAVVDLLFEPLLHIIRNAMDHGVEAAAKRAGAGKPEVATLRLSARRDGADIVIEVEDDGSGIDPARLRVLAEQRHLVDSATLAAASEDELLDLIFLPGFSTKDGVSELSGRGVGLDAVRSNVERIGGRVGLTSEVGRGTRFTLRLPFSLMITRVITVEAGGQMFAVPLESVAETVRVPRERLRPIGTIAAFAWRSGVVPLLDLAAILGGERERAAGAFAYVIVLSLAGQFAALEVDRVGEEMEVILKPFDGLLSGAAGIAGATVLGDGQVLLVLDVGDLLA